MTNQPNYYRNYGLVGHSVKAPKVSPKSKVRESLICLAITIVIICLTIWLFGCKPKGKETLNCDKQVLTHCQNVPEGKK
jgi:hypothetical protein